MSSHFSDMAVVGRDAPLRLAQAARIAFPNGSMTASGLRRERDRGRLVVERIAGKDFTTLANIERMRELCRVEAKASGFGSSPQSGVPTEKSSGGQPGSSETGRVRSARAALEKTAQGLK